jgi:hypothetical protein
MKGQISFVEFLVTMAIFITFVGYFSFQLTSFFPIYLNEVRNERVRSEIYQLSEILMNDPGDPANWRDSTSDSVKRIGLSNENFNKTNYLSLTKITNFNLNCPTNYETIRSKLGSQLDFSVILFERYPTDQKLIECKPPVTTIRAINSTIRRIVYFDSGGYGELIIQMW